MSIAERDVPVTVIEPSSGKFRLGLRELWEYRELVLFFVWRDIKVRYKQTALGAAWAVIQPFFTMVVFSLFFGRLAGMPSDGAPYPLWSFAALVPWTFFANGITQSSQSLVMQQNLVRKVYFPRLAVPLSAVLSGIVDFAIACGVLLLMMLAWGATPGVGVLALPALLLIALAACLGAGFLLAAINVRYRDVRYAVPFLIQFWLFATPVAYPSSLLPAVWRPLYALNPMVGVVEGFRWALLGTASAPVSVIAVSAASAAVILVVGLRYFRLAEHRFADVV